MRDNTEVSPRDCVCLLKMEPSSQSRDGGGLWNQSRPIQYSKETQDIVRCEMIHLFIFWCGWETVE